MKCPKPTNCHFCYNSECFATHYWECAEGFKKRYEWKNGRKVNNRYGKKGE